MKNADREVKVYNVFKLLHIIMPTEIALQFIVKLLQLPIYSNTILRLTKLSNFT